MQPKTGDYHLVLFETTTIVIGFIVLAELFTEYKTLQAT